MGILQRLARRIVSKDLMTNIAAGNLAPGFSLKSLEDQEYSLGKLLRRGPVVLAFFKISCPVCQFTFPFIERLSIVPVLPVPVPEALLLLYGRLS